MSRPSLIAKKDAVRVRHAFRGEAKVGGAVELPREQADAEHAEELAGRIGDGLLHADLHALLRLGQRGIELRPVQVARDKAAVESPARRSLEREVLGGIGERAAGLAHGRR